MSSSFLEIIIEPNAIVALSSQLHLETSGESASPPSSPNIKLVIAGGNLLHPHSRLSIIPPPHVTQNETESQGESLVIRIGENNVFEEECDVILDLRQAGKKKSKEDVETIVNIIGSYNQFAPRCHVRSNRIGSANIFQSMCNLEIPYIKNGNIFGNMLQVIDVDEEGQSFQEKTLFIVSNNEKQIDSRQQLIRPHKHGMKKNMREVGLLLGSTRKLVQKNHRIMAVTSEVSS